MKKTISLFLAVLIFHISSFGQSKHTVEKGDQLIMFDYSSMSKAVQDKVNENKQKGTRLSDGIVKVYTVHDPVFVSNDMQIAALQFLKENKNFIRSIWQSTSVVKIYVQPEMKSEDLKFILKEKLGEVEFTQEQYQLAN